MTFQHDNSKWYLKVTFEIDISRQQMVLIIANLRGRPMKMCRCHHRFWFFWCGCKVLMCGGGNDFFDEVFLEVFSCYYCLFLLRLVETVAVCGLDWCAVVGFGFLACYAVSLADFRRINQIFLLSGRCPAEPRRLTGPACLCWMHSNGCLCYLWLSRMAVRCLLAVSGLLVLGWLLALSISEVVMHFLNTVCCLGWRVYLVAVFLWAWCLCRGSQLWWWRTPDWRW